MTSGQRPKVLIIATHCDASDVGETWNAYKWIAGLAAKCSVTLLTQYRQKQLRPSLQIPMAEVIEWEEPRWFSQHERFNAMLKPWYFDFYRRSKREIFKLIARGESFDIFHQLTPIAIRYPTPCIGFNTPYIIGPLSGGLPTPQSFRMECGSAPWYTQLRYLDQIRLRYDPLLKRTYSAAALVLGAAPYIRELLGSIHLKRFDVECEVGIDSLASLRVHPGSRSHGDIHLLYVGRAIRTKGLRDLIRAMARLSDLKVKLIAAGDGEDLGACVEEARALGVAGKIQFLGRVPRADVERLYSTADVFVFPSFREPTGGVILRSDASWAPGCHYKHWWSRLHR